MKRERGLLEVRGASTAAHCLTAAPSAHTARLFPCPRRTSGACGETAQYCGLFLFLICVFRHRPRLGARPGWQRTDLALASFASMSSFRIHVV